VQNCFLRREVRQLFLKKEAFCAKSENNDAFSEIMTPKNRRIFAPSK